MEYFVRVNLAIVMFSGETNYLFIYLSIFLPIYFFPSETVTWGLF